MTHSGFSVMDLTIFGDINGESHMMGTGRVFNLFKRLISKQVGLGLWVRTRNFLLSK